VIPNVRLTVSFSGISDNTAKVEIGYDKIDSDGKLLKIGVVWSTYPYPNVTVFPEGNIIIQNVSTMELDKGKRMYEVTQLKSGATYYLRAFALTNNAGAYYNYSKQITLEVK